ncbi:MAG: NACHT domain protein, partial [Delftia sp.]|nr:NACHT domain protein [Delftia sp.]
CGLEHDSTYLIRQVYQVEPVMAFACLGDAQQVETDYVAELVDVFKSRLAEAANDENLARAFALVAADPRHRGETLFDFVRDSLDAPTLRPAAAAVLALTNLPRAADALAECAAHDPTTRPYLIQMGDLSVPALATRARRHQTWALDALHEVGTPQAALALLPLLWDGDARLPYHAA